ncbi:MAG TPA: hypothetical protein DDZ80_32090 [Cyanobacteria bacterium UBA8803]|nr:hypothetical protein [Cyanobacteria bacterium UBA9273]HBL62847.1 hypothetical protein [Cyanobacteria bacterium UBA8803]
MNDTKDFFGIIYLAAIKPYRSIQAALENVGLYPDLISNPDLISTKLPVNQKLTLELFSAAWKT